MATRARRRVPVFLLALTLASAGCAESPAASPGSAGTAELRAAIFDSLVARVARRDAFSDVKNRTLAYDPLAEMRALRDEVVGADTEEALFYALTKLSNARRNRHLDVALVSGGLQVPDSAGLDVWGGPAASEPPRAPVRILPDFGDEGGFFVGDVAEHPAVAGGPRPGDRVVAVDGAPMDAWAEAVRPWVRHSSPAGLAWQTGELVALRSAILPPGFRGERLVLETEDREGVRSIHELPYLPGGPLTWRRVSEPAYPGLERRLRTPTYDLLVPGDGRPLLVLVWTGFRETMLADVDTLMALAEREGLLDHAVVVDVTRSRGGSLGPYAIQRLQPRAFKTTFGTLRLSDLTPAFIADRRGHVEAGTLLDGGVPETMDGGAWLMDWLENDVVAELATGAEHTRPVPFKLAHAPRDSDGTLQPAPVHFRGAFGVISGPNGGSHLDQFNAIVKDNGLGPIVGMPAGGYSNTWEWQEVVAFPGSEQPLVGFMYDIGHTVRPNGEVLEGNPALVDEWIPLTAEGLETYYPRLLEAVLARMAR